MKKYLKQIIVLIIQILIFYIFPIFFIKFDPMGMVFLILISTFLLSIIIGINSNGKIKIIYPFIVSLIFIPSVFIYYNESALIHSIWYLIVSYSGIILGLIIDKIVNRK